MRIAFEHEDLFQILTAKIKSLELAHKPRAKKDYYRVACCLDIESTNTVAVIDGELERQAFMYIWCFQIDDLQITGRYWAEFDSILQHIEEVLELNGEGDGKILFPIFVHNLSFEWNFIKLQYEWTNVLAYKKNDMICATTRQGIEFRCSYNLSGYNLATLAKTLGMKKLVGDLDYDKLRTPETPLTTKEMGYVYEDTNIVVAYINSLLKEYAFFNDIPLTNTGFVRNDVKDHTIFQKTAEGKRDTRAINKYKRDYIRESTISPSQYPMLTTAFAGGFTHSNPAKTGMVLENVYSQDFTSSYPATMASELFPMGRPIELGYLELEDHQGLLPKLEFEYHNRFNTHAPKLSVVTVILYDLEARFKHDFYLSKHKCLIKTPATAKISNGRIVSADMVQITVTIADWAIINKTYDFSKAVLHDVLIWKASPLPRNLLVPMLNFYKAKTELKDVEGREIEYNNGKSKINAIYGMMVSSIIREDYDFQNGDWIVHKPDLEEALEKENNNWSRFLYYPWGVFITAYARYNLWTGILAIGEDYIYADTDSIKYQNHEKHAKYFEAYNRNVERKLRIIARRRNIDFEMFRPKTNDGVEKMLGVWDFEGCYTMFKTLGAKRYLTYEEGRRNKQGELDELHITVAGLPKKNGLNYLLKKGVSVEGVFTLFEDGLEVPEEETGKMTHSITKPATFEVIDYEGNRCMIESTGGTHLRPASFSMSMDGEFRDLIEEFKSILERGNFV